MAMDSDLETRKREISALVAGVKDIEQRLQMPPQGEDFEDYDRFEALDIINRIERRLMTNMPIQEAAE